MSRSSTAGYDRHPARPGARATERYSVKVRVGAVVDEVRDHLAALPGVVSVTPTFPGEEDDDLARLLSVSLDAQNAAQALRRLRGQRALEFVERVVPHHLVRQT